MTGGPHSGQTFRVQREFYDYFLGGKDNYPADRDAGLPTMGNVHEVAMAASPATRVVYVDHDPVVLAHARPSDCYYYALVARKP